MWINVLLCSCRSSLVFVQEVEISVWKTRAIRMKETTQMDKDNPSSPRRSSKRGPESFKRFSSPKKLCAMVIETLSTPDKETGNWAHFTMALLAGAWWVGLQSVVHKNSEPEHALPIHLVKEKTDKNNKLVFTSEQVLDCGSDPNKAISHSWSKGVNTGMQVYSNQEAFVTSQRALPLFTF